MRDGWFERLQEVIKADGRSHRALSMDAELGPNFVNQMLTTPKIPSVENLSKILDLLDETARPYVLLNLKLTRQDLTALDRLAQLTPEARTEFESFLDQLAAGAESPAHDADPQQSEKPVSE